jgi:CheY-like chemotaxis protein
MATLDCILLVEDDPNDTELTLTTLQQHNMANQVVTVRDGVEALDYLYCRGKYAGRPDGHPLVILLDLKLPQPGGMEVLKKLKSDRLLYTIPVIVLTSSCKPGDLKESYRLGANAYMLKPVLFGDFLEVMLGTGVACALINQPATRKQLPA